MHLEVSCEQSRDTRPASCICRWSMRRRQRRGHRGGACHKACLRRHLGSAPFLSTLWSSRPNGDTRSAKPPRKIICWSSTFPTRMSEKRVVPGCSQRGFDVSHHRIHIGKHRGRHLRISMGTGSYARTRHGPHRVRHEYQNRRRSCRTWPHPLSQCAMPDSTMCGFPLVGQLKHFVCEVKTGMASSTAPPPTLPGRAWLH